MKHRLQPTVWVWLGPSKCVVDTWEDIQQRQRQHGVRHKFTTVTGSTLMDARKRAALLLAPPSLPPHEDRPICHDKKPCDFWTKAIVVPLILSLCLFIVHNVSTDFYYHYCHKSLLDGILKNQEGKSEGKFASFFAMLPSSTTAPICRFVNILQTTTLEYYYLVWDGLTLAACSATVQTLRLAINWVA